MKEYKDTLNLPKTEFAMKANLPNKEPELLNYWKKIDLYTKLKEKGKGKEKFILHDGPPYANGAIHIGHAVNKTLKDIVVKSQSLSGKYSPYKPGWDCHGLPIELNVEKKLGKVGDKVSAKEFRKACRIYAKEQIEIQKEEFKRLGVLGDWEKPYSTMDSTFEAGIVRSLGKIVSKGYVIRGEKPVHWCVDCGSALAEAEVEYQDKISPSIDFGFPIDTKKINALFNLKLDMSIYVASWTTTPWTVPGNVALTVNGEFDYCLIQVKKDLKDYGLLVGKDLIVNTLGRIDIDNFEVLGTCKGKELEGLEAKHPYLARPSKFVLGDHVTIEVGTGIVHTSPGHGLEDYTVAQEYDLEVLSPVKNNGTFNSNEEHVGGLFAFKANERIIEVLNNEGTLFGVADYKHSYPHCWRHKTPLMFRATPQWFISMDQGSLLVNSIDAIREVNWEPNWGETRMSSMLNRPDWCISRQRAWGVPIPLLIHKETRELHPDTDQLIEEIAKKIEDQGIESWHEIEVEQLINDSSNYQKVTDVLDVWFDSGVTHACVLHDEDLQFPADLYLEGSDQHRGWFQSSLLTSMAIYDTPPYKGVLTHGFVVDADGRKMSKSIGNTISPQEIWNSKGADVLRAWIASTDYRNEMVISNNRLQGVSDSYRRIRNTIRFLLGNIQDFSMENRVKEHELTELDKYMENKTQKLQKELIEDYLNYRFHLAFNKIHNFCANDLGGFYLDVLKDRLYTCNQDSVARRSCQTILFQILEALVRWISPILTFTAEEAWLLYHSDFESVHLTEWFDDWLSSSEGAISESDWEQVLKIRTEVNKIIESSRNSGLIGSSLEAEIELFCSVDLEKLLGKFSQELKFIFITSEAKVLPENGEGEETDLEGLKVRVNKTLNKKCERCWHSRPEVGSINDHPHLCSRCLENIEGNGETRLYA
mgnify:FL=1